MATPQNEAQLLDYAQQATAEQVQRRCQQMHNADRAASTHDVNEIHRGRFLRRRYAGAHDDLHRAHRGSGRAGDGRAGAGDGGAGRIT